MYFVYSNLLSASKVWLEKGDLPPAIGVWWVHLAALALGLYLVVREARTAVNTLDRYLYRTVLVYTAMAMAVLLTLGALFLFISQQSDIGVGSYSAADAFLFTLLNLPQQAFELLPIGAMIGALMGLGNLAAGSELVVTRASGVSVWRIAWPVGLAGLTLVARSCTASANTSAPPMAQFAKREKTTDKLADVSFAGSSSAWVKDGNLILRVQTGEVDRAFGGVSLFELDGPTDLRSIQRAERISVADPGRWSLHNVATSRFGDDRVDGDVVSEVDDALDRQSGVPGPRGHRSANC